MIFSRPVIPAAALAAVLVSVLPRTALAAPDPIRIRGAVVRPTPSGAAAASAHLVIAETGRADDQLLGVTSPDAARVEVHAMDMTGGVMRMRPVAGPLRLPAGGVLDLSPAAGRHLMLIGPKRPLRPGDRVHLVLRFAHAAPHVVEAPVVAERP